MTKPLRFDDEAAEELEQAAAWYEERRDGLGSELIAAVRDALASISRHPHTWLRVPGVPADLGLRRVLLRRFPFAIVYVELEAEIRLLAVAHDSREPGYWRRRI